MKQITVNYFNKSFQIPISSSLNEFKKEIQNKLSITDEEMKKIKLIVKIENENMDCELNDSLYDDVIKNNNYVNEIKIIHFDSEKNKEILDLFSPTINSLILKCNGLEKEIKNITKEFEDYKKDKGEKIELLYKYFIENINLNRNKKKYVKSSSFNLFRNSIVNDNNNSNQPNIPQNSNEQEIKDNNTLNNFLKEKDENEQADISIFNRDFLENIYNEAKQNEEKRVQEFNKKQSLLSDFYNEFLKDKKDEVKPKEENPYVGFDKKQSLLSEFYNEFLQDKKDEVKLNEENQYHGLDKKQSLLSEFYNEFLKD